MVMNIYHAYILQSKNFISRKKFGDEFDSVIFFERKQKKNRLDFKKKKNNKVQQLFLTFGFSKKIFHYI